MGVTSMECWKMAGGFNRAFSARGHETRRRGLGRVGQTLKVAIYPRLRGGRLVNLLLTRASVPVSWRSLPRSSFLWALTGLICVGFLIFSLPLSGIDSHLSLAWSSPQILPQKMAELHRLARSYTSSLLIRRISGGYFIVIIATFEDAPGKRRQRVKLARERVVERERRVHA